jgi:hypothetical protein
MLVMNNIFANAAQIGVKRVAASSLVTYNDFWSNGTDYTGSNVDTSTTLFQDPLLDSNYNLEEGSPCIDAGAASIVWNGKTVSAPPYSGAAPDLGAHETSSSGNTVSFQDGVSPSPSYAGTRDTYISQGSPTSNFGASTTIKVNGAAGNDLSGLVKWDISSIAAGNVVQTVTITFNVTNKSANSYQVYELKRPWVENQATWNVYATGSNWSVPGAQGSSDRGSTVLGTVTASALGSYTLTLNSSGVALVQSWVNTPSTNNGIIIANATNTDNLVLSSRSATTPAKRPKLTVTYVGGT